MNLTKGESLQIDNKLAKIDTSDANNERSIVLDTTASPAGKHSCQIGTPGINEFVINWTDSKNYVTIDKAVNDEIGSYGSDSWTVTIFDITAHTANDTNDNSTLSYEIFWHPAKKNGSNVPEQYIDPEVHASRSDITIQGRKAVLVKFNERKVYEGSDKSPTISPARFYVSYFPDDYTAVTIYAPASEWKDSDFKNAMSSLKITPTAGYY